MSAKCDWALREANQVRLSKGANIVGLYGIPSKVGF